MKRYFAIILAIQIIVVSISSCAGLPPAGTKPEEVSEAPEEPALPVFRYAGEGSASRQLEDLFTTIDLIDADISQLTAEMEAGHVTSAELTRMYLDRIDTYDDALNLNSITNVNPNALREAQALDRERAAGRIRGPLHGIPVIIKDNIDVAGMPTTSGSAAFAGNVAQEDAFVVKRLREAGAVILAKANMSEFATSAITSHSTYGGDVHNAYDTSKTPGGSSGGTAVAVTCSFAAAGLGTDTGGSIRFPAAFSNLYGLRPSKGLTSTDGVFPLVKTNDTVGPMTRTAQDLAVLLEVMAGTDENDDFTLEADADALKGDGYLDNCRTDGLQGMRIGILTNSFTFHPDEQFRKQLSDYLKKTGQKEEDVVAYTAGDNVRDMVNRARENLMKAGATIVDISDVLPEETLESLFEDVEMTDTELYDMDKFLSENPGSAYGSMSEIAEAGSPEASENVVYSNIFSFMPKPEKKDGDAKDDKDSKKDTKKKNEKENEEETEEESEEENEKENIEESKKENKEENEKENKEENEKESKKENEKASEKKTEKESEEESEEEPEGPYTYITEDGYARPPYWEKCIENRETVNKILEENNIDAVMYLEFYNVPPDDAAEEEIFPVNYAAYMVYYPVYMGFPEIMLPMGFSEVTEDHPSSLPLGLSVFAGFGKDDKLVQIACAYQRQAGSLIRRAPEITPALRDEKLNGFLDALMEAAWSIDTSGFEGPAAGRARMMENALEKAADADLNDPYAVYKAAADLAGAYDKLLEAIG